MSEFFCLLCFYFMKTPVTAYLSLGSNLGDRAFLLQKALLMLQDSAGDIEKISGVYETPAWGFESDKFLNLCIELKTRLSPQQLLSSILKIE